MTRKVTYIAIQCFALVFVGDVEAQRGYSAGFTNMEKESGNSISVGIWYPSTEQETRRKWGPFQPMLAWEGKPASGLFPIIIFSHGVTGRYRNHRDTSAALARAGYVVIAPQHTQDIWVGTDRTVSAIEYRIGEIAKSLDAAKTHSILRGIMDETMTGAIGYSLGGLTVLGANGLLPSYAHYNRHCDKNSVEDPNFCTVIPWWQKVLLWFKGTELDDKDEFSPTSLPIEFQSIALIAPVGAIFPEDQIRDIRAKIAIYRLGDDTQVTYPFHAEYIYRSLDQNNARYKVYENVHHYAFISPFPDWLLEEEHIPVAIDPEGFDRKIFLEEINAEIVDFFQKNLPHNNQYSSRDQGS